MAVTDSIAHYRIGAKLGQGAMGEVYRATDTKLGRDVALKVITPALAGDPARLAGVSREAQVLASLNHPNIAAVYGIEDHAIVMELVEGPTLADRLKQGPIALDEALAIARQIAAGLEAAHEKGIVHRDLKPGNVKITADGTIKLLDFGLAKHAALAAAAEDATIAASTSGDGLIVGTPAYMAPEQVRGRPVDKRVDVWAFGVVVYEMLTGSKLFDGDAPTDVMASVVTKEPDLSRVPPIVRPMLRRCLEKDPKKRLRDVADALLLLESTGEGSAAAVATTAGRTRLWIAAGLAAVFAIALAIVSFLYLRESPPAASVVRFTTTLPQNVNFTQNGFFAVSPDGQKIAFPAIGSDGVARLWIQQVDSLAPVPIMGVEIPAALDTLFWSPDSRFLAFTTFPPSRQLKRIDVTGGPAQTIADLPMQVLGGTWGDGGILLGSFEGILQVPASGGKPTLVTKVDPSRKEVSHQGAAFLPDDRHFLYSRGGLPGTRGLFVGSLDVKPEEQNTTPVMTTDFGGTFVRDRRSRSGGWLFFVRDGALLAQRFDPGAASLAGEASTVVEQVGVLNGTAAGGAYYSVTGQGTLAYKTGAGITEARQLAWLDRQGRAVGAASELTQYTMLKVSPDGTRVATMRRDLAALGGHIWVTDVARDTSIKLTLDNARNDSQPVWSPDGKRVAWQGSREGSSEFYVKAADGSGAEQALYKFTGPAPVLTDWSSDGRFLVFSRGGDVFALPVGEGTDSKREPIAVVQGPANELGAYVSPDSRWLTYLSNESGRQEIYVQPFAPSWTAAGLTAPTGKWLVSTKGSLGLARWREDGKELLYAAADGTLMAVEVRLSPTFKSGVPQPLFKFPSEFLAQSRTPGSIADVSRDHQRIYLLLPAPDLARQGINVILNWPALLK